MQSGACAVLVLLQRSPESGLPFSETTVSIPLLCSVDKFGRLLGEC